MESREKITIDSQPKPEVELLDSQCATPATPPSEEEESSQRASETQPEEKLPVLRLSSLVLGMALALFVSGFDSSVIPNLVPALTAEFGAIQDTGWYGSAFLFAFGASQPVLGKIYSEFSVRISYNISAIVFAVGSVMCAVSKSPGMFIASRALAGLGSGGITTGTIIISYQVLPERLFPLCNGLVGAFEASATIAGPLVGGAMASTIGWEWVFWINLPIVAVAMALVLLLYPALKRDDDAPATPPAATVREKVERLDLVGGALLAGSVLCLLFGVHEAGGSGSTGRTAGLMTAAAVLLLVTGFQQHRRGPEATFPLRLFLNRHFAAALLYGFFMKASESVVYYQLPMWFQTVKCASARRAAVMLLPSLLALIVGSIFTGIAASMARRIAPFVLVGAAVAAAGAMLLHELKVGATAAQWIGYQVAYGFGCGIGMQLALVGVQTALEAKNVPFGSSAAMLSRILGGAVFILVAQKIYLDRLGSLADIDQLSPCGIADPDRLDATLHTYSEATAKAMIVAVVLMFGAVASAVFVRWALLKDAKSKPVTRVESDGSGTEPTSES